MKSSKDSKSCWLEASVGVALLAVGGVCGAAEPAAASTDDDSVLQEVVVTAQRREESAQNTPVAVSALSAAQLQSAGVQSLGDLNTVVPGIHLTSSGSEANTVFSIRGLSRGSVGNEQPAVQSYVNEVPLSPWGANIPTYDIANVQVLKGPQGTLFGLNAEAGAILVNTTLPSYEFGGYLQATGGSYSWNQYEGAVNLPLVDQKLAVRLAGQIARRDGYVENRSFPGWDMNDVHGDSFRVSVLADPTDWLQNILVYDYYRSLTHGKGNVLYTFDPNPALPVNAIYGAFTQFGLCAGFPAVTCNAGLAYQRQLAEGPYAGWAPDRTYTDVRIDGVINTTTLRLGGGNIALKNIFGFRKVYADQKLNVSGLEAPASLGTQVADYQQFTDELNLSGTSFDDTLTWIGGGFWLQSEPSGISSNTVQTFNPPGIPNNYSGPQFLPGIVLGGFGPAQYYNATNRAVYGQVNYKLSGLWPALEGVSVDAGMRYAEDELKYCGLGGQLVGTGFPPQSACTSANIVRSPQSSQTTYTAGLNYQMTHDVLMYVSHRTGYRAGGINSPVFAGALIPFQTYPAETSRQLEVGLKSEWQFRSIRGRFNVDLFQTKYEDLHGSINTAGINQALPAGVDGTGQASPNAPVPLFYTAIGEATVKGFEIEAVVVPFDGLELTANGAWYDKKIDSIDLVTPANWLAGGIPPYSLSPASIAFYGDPAGNAFLGSPKYSYTLGANYRLPLNSDIGEIKLYANYYKSSGAIFGPVYAPGYHEIDLRLSWNSIYESPFDVSIFVTNLNDAAAVSGPSLTVPGFGITSVAYTEPRMVGGQIRYHFGAE